jgi:hypothetical protein
MKAKVGRGGGFRGVLDYALNKDDARIVGGNMSGLDARELAHEFGAARALRPDVDRPVWHTSLSAAPGEKLSDEQWQSLAQEFMKGMGFSESTPFLVVRHAAGEDQNTPLGQGPTTEHVHIIASRIDLAGDLWHGKWEARTAIELTQQLEKKFGLIETKGLDAERPEKKRASKAETERGERLGETPARTQLQDKVSAAMEGGATVREFVDRLHASGVNVRPNLASTGKMNGFSFELGGVAFKGSDLGKAYTFSGLQKSGLDYSPARDTAFLAGLTTQPLNTPRRAVSSPVVPVANRTTAPKQRIQKIGKLPRSFVPRAGLSKIARAAIDTIDQLAKALRKWQTQINQTLWFYQELARTERQKLAAQALANVKKRAELASAPTKSTAPAVASQAHSSPAQSTAPPAVASQPKAAQPPKAQELDKLRQLVDSAILGKGIKKTDALISAVRAGDAASIDKLLDAGAVSSLRAIDAAKLVDDARFKRLIEAEGTSALDSAGLRDLSKKVTSPEIRQRLDALAKAAKVQAHSGSGAGFGNGVKNSGPRGPS